MLGNSVAAVVVVVVRTCPRAIPLAMKTMRKSFHGFPLLSYMSMGLRLAALCTQIWKPSGKHTEVSTEGDISALVEQFLEADLYRKIPGRKHSAFPEMKHNLLTDLNVDELKSWIFNSLKKFSRKHFYKY